MFLKILFTALRKRELFLFSSVVRILNIVKRHLSMIFLLFVGNKRFWMLVDHWNKSNLEWDLLWWFAEASVRQKQIFKGLGGQGGKEGGWWGEEREFREPGERESLFWQTICKKKTLLMGKTLIRASIQY